MRGRLVVVVVIVIVTNDFINIPSVFFSGSRNYKIMPRPPGCSKIL